MRNVLILVTISFTLVLNSIGQSSDSLKLKLDGAEGVERIDVLQQLLLNIWLNYPDQAMAYGEEALTLSQTLNDSVNISKSLRLIAGVHYYRGNYDESLDYNNRALAIAVIIHDSSLINNGYNNIGLLHYNLGSYQTALEYLFRSKHIKENIGETYGLATTVNNIGMVYEKVSDFAIARNYFFEGLEIAKKTNDSDQEVYSLNNIGLTYLRENRIDTALQYYLKARMLAKKVGNVNWGAVSLRGIGEILQQINQYDSANYYYNESLKASLLIDDKKGLSEVYYLLSTLSLTQHNYDLAINYLDKGHEVATNLKSRHQLLDNLKLYAAIYLAMNDMENAILYKTKYIDMRDSLFLDISSRNLALIPIKINEEENRIKLIDQQAEIERKNITNNLFIIIIFISIPLIGFLIILIRKIRFANRALKKNNSEIQTQKEEIIHQNSKLQQTIDQLRKTQDLLIESEKMASIGQLVAGLAHELNNPLNFIGGIIKPMEMNLEEIKEHGYKNELQPVFDEMKMLLNDVTEGTKRASGIIEKLRSVSPQSLSAKYERFNLTDCLHETVSFIKNQIKTSNIVLDIPNDIFITSNRYEVSKIFYNIIINGIEACDQEGRDNKGFVNISIEEKEKKIDILVKDDGNGISEGDKKYIFDPFFSAKEGTSGLGLYVAYSLVQRNGGNISVESELKKGSLFIISLPK